jgi:hypothetical protein
LILFNSPNPNRCHYAPSNGAQGAILVYYRLYLLANPDGRFIGFEEIDASDDVEAVRIAEQFRGRHPLELWCGQRRVKSFAAKKVTAA